MKARIIFRSCLEIPVDDKMVGEMVPQEEQVRQLKRLLMEELDCESVEISEYSIEFK